MANALKSRQHDEFTLQTLPGLALATEIMTPEYEQEMIALIDRLELADAPQPEAGRRFNRAFGWGYDPKSYDLVPADPLPVEMESLRYVAAEFAGIDPDDMSHCMVSRFEPGSMIPWLKMRGIWNQLVGISLGNSTPISFRKAADSGAECIDLRLEPRTMYLLSGEVRYDYEHSFPATEEARWCLWFRDLSVEGRKFVEIYQH